MRLGQGVAGSTRGVCTTGVTRCARDVLSSSGVEDRRYRDRRHRHPSGAEIVRRALTRHTITFHGLGPLPEGISAGEADVWLDERSFVAVLDILAARNDVAVTFDDGNRSDVDIALPHLLERGLHATFFVVGDRIGDAAYLGDRDLQLLASHGMTIGSHGMSHRPWRQLDDTQLRSELETSRRLLADLAQQRISDCSAPSGAYDRRVVQMTRAAGFDRMFTSDRGPTRSHWWLQPRASLHRDDPLGELAKVLANGLATRAKTSIARRLKAWS